MYKYATAVLFVLFVVSASAAGYFASIKPMEVTVTTTATVTGTVTGAPVTFEEQARAAFPKAEDAKINWRQFEGTTLNFLFVSHPWEAAISPYIPEFEKLTGTTVQMEVVSEDIFWDRVILGLQSTTPVFDLAFASQGYDSYSYYANKWVVPLNQFLDNPQLTDKNWYDPDDMYPVFKNAFLMPDGKIYALPITFEVYMMFYRKDLFQQYQVDVPTTMQGWLDAIQKFQGMSTTTGVYGAAIRGGSQTGISDEFAAMALNYWGDRPYDSDKFVYFDSNWKPRYTDPAITQAFDTWATVMKNGPPGITTYDWSEATTAFAQGKTATYWFDASLFRGIFEDPTQSQVVGKVGYAVVPSTPTGHKTVAWCWGLMIPSNSENQEAAWLFEEWATSKLTNVLTGVKTSAATRASSWAFQPMTAGFPADFTTAVSESLKIASPDNIYYEHMEEIVLKQNEALHAIYLGTSVQTAIANLQAAAEQIMTANPPSTGA